MESYIPFLIIGGVLVLVVGGIAWGIYHERKRTEKIQEVAKELGLPFYSEGDSRLLPDLDCFHLFSQGRGGRISNMIHGDTGDVRVGIFDYQYVTGHGKHRHTWRQTVVFFQSSGLRLPQFTLRPEHIFHKLGSVFGQQDIDFDSHPQFSHNFLLQGSDEDAIRKLFRPELLAFMEGRSGISVEGQSNNFIYYRAAARVNPDNIRGFMEEGFQIFGLLKV